MTNSSASCFCVLCLSSKWHSLCLWCRWAFVGAFILIGQWQEIPQSNPAFSWWTASPLNCL